jgi:SAM-dependent methyltransferase
MENISQEIRKHYEVEKAIALKLKRASREERKDIYKIMYDELFSQVPWHPRLKLREDLAGSKKRNKKKFNLINRYLNDSVVFVEFGPGDCRFALEVCKRVKYVYGVDILDQIGVFQDIPDNFKLIIYDGFDLKIGDDLIDVVFSDMLLEHLHPDDIEEHFLLVKRILKPGGIYFFRTPHRFSGPHDVSKYFSEEVEGLHLKEWTYKEIKELIIKLGFSSWSSYWTVMGVRIRMPFLYFRIMERLFGSIPRKIRRRLSDWFLPAVVMSVVK